MPRILLLSILLLAACQQSAPAEFAPSACETKHFEGSGFVACAVEGGAVELHTFDKAGAPMRSFSNLQASLGKRAPNVAFAMNAGMFDDEGRPIGLLIEGGEQKHAINLRKGGGNFHLLPNGVFLVRKSGKAEVVPSTAYEPSKDIAFATQSGPMLLIDGKLHPKFDQDGPSQNIRNGVGIAPDGTAVFVISQDPVSFGRFARFFRDRVRARNALYFDGVVSSLWDPAGHRMDSHTEIGPMAVVFVAPRPASARRKQ
ncbi:MAG TPA: phosphodiester glycosidase family protein [Sphingomicrobium sp.]|jgi:uncharacterized protein YigE (DUF2233 family)